MRRPLHTVGAMLEKRQQKAAAAPDVRLIGRDIRYACAMPSHRQAELGERSANLAESCDDLPGRREQEEFARVAGAVLQQRRGRIATGADLYRVNGEARGLDVITRSSVAAC